MCSSTVQASRSAAETAVVRSRYTGFCRGYELDDRRVSSHRGQTVRRAGAGAGGMVISSFPRSIGIMWPHPASPESGLRTM